MTRLNRDQLVQLAKSQITEWTPHQLDGRRKAKEAITVVDVRERDEWMQGHIPQ